MNRIFFLAAVLACASVAAVAQQAVQVWTPLGYQQITPVPTLTKLTIPAGTQAGAPARWAQICVATNAVKWRDDGTAPTATVGMTIAAGSCYAYSGSLSAIQFIQVTSPAILDVSYYN